MIFSTLITPGTVLLILASGLSFAYGWNNVYTVVFLSILTILYGAICFHKRTKKYQLLVAQALTFIFAVLMCAVVVGTIVQIVDDVGKKNCVGVCVLSVSLCYEVKTFLLAT